MDFVLEQKIIIFGGVGLVGQNLVVIFRCQGYCWLVVIDKYVVNFGVFVCLYLDVVIEYVDFVEFGVWECYFVGVDVVVMLQVQIGGIDLLLFVCNNIIVIDFILDVIECYVVFYMVYVSFLVVCLVVDDDYICIKCEQE